jgi:hypothetical protein
MLIERVYTKPQVMSSEPNQEKSTSCEALFSGKKTNQNLAVV